MPEDLAKLPRTEVPLLPYAPMGVDNLLSVFRAFHRCTRPYSSDGTDASQSGLPLSTLIDELEKAGRGVVMTMGKGGVGKTTVASAIAIELAHRGHAGPSQHYGPGGPRFSDGRGSRSEPYQ